jgi:bacterioferritin (cytochrome b1)
MKQVLGGQNSLPGLTRPVDEQNHCEWIRTQILTIGDIGVERYQQSHIGHD